MPTYATVADEEAERARRALEALGASPVLGALAPSFGPADDAPMQGEQARRVWENARVEAPGEKAPAEATLMQAQAVPAQRRALSTMIRRPATEPARTAHGTTARQAPSQASQRLALATMEKSAVGPKREQPGAMRSNTMEQRGDPEDARLLHGLGQAQEYDQRQDVMFAMADALAGRAPRGASSDSSDRAQALLDRYRRARGEREDREVQGRRQAGIDAGRAADVARQTTEDEQARETLRAARDGLPEGHPLRAALADERIAGMGTAGLRESARLIMPYIRGQDAPTAATTREDTQAAAVEQIGARGAQSQDLERLRQEGRRRGRAGRGGAGAPAAPSASPLDPDVQAVARDMMTQGVATDKEQAIAAAMALPERERAIRARQIATRASVDRRGDVTREAVAGRQLSAAGRRVAEELNTDGSMAALRAGLAIRRAMRGASDSDIAQAIAMRETGRGGRAIGGALASERATRIHDEWVAMINLQLHSLSGAAVTVSEMSRFMSEMGSLSPQAFRQQFDANFRRHHASVMSRADAVGLTPEDMAL